MASGSSMLSGLLAGIGKPLMEQWIHLPTNRWMMYFYNDRVELCEAGRCKPVEGRTAQNAGLATR